MPLFALQLATFEEFCARFGKSYEDPTEAAYRAGIYATNLARINAHNIKGESYTLGVNQFTDMTADEWRAATRGRRAAKPSTMTPTTVAPEILAHVAALPASVDWRTKGAVTKVKNQGQYVLA